MFVEKAVCAALSLLILLTVATELGATPNKRQQSSNYDVITFQTHRLKRQAEDAATPVPPGTTTLPQTPISRPTLQTPTASSTGSGDDSFGNCWSCLFDLVEEICSFFNFLDDSEESDSDSNSGIFSLFPNFNFGGSNRPPVSNATPKPPVRQPALARFARSSSRDDSVNNETAFFESLHLFYVKARQRFAEENPSIPLSSDMANLYKRPYEVAEVASFVMKVPLHDLIKTFDQLKTKDTGRRLLEVLDARQEVRNVHGDLDSKAFSGLSTTSISYFFKELLGSFNGVSTAVSEFMSVWMNNKATPSPNKIL